jgi:hypothetical protein
VPFIRTSELATREAAVDHPARNAVAGIDLR